MKTVWKFPFSGPSDVLTAHLPANARVLSFGLQHNVPTLWILGDFPAEENLEHRTFRLLCTGQSADWISGELDHIGSALGYDDRLVLHCFEDVKP